MALKAISVDSFMMMHSKNWLI